MVDVIVKPMSYGSIESKFTVNEFPDTVIATYHGSKVDGKILYLRDVVNVPFEQIEMVAKLFTPYFKMVHVLSTAKQIDILLDFISKNKSKKIVMLDAELYTYIKKVFSSKNGYYLASNIVSFRLSRVYDTDKNFIHYKPHAIDIPHDRDCVIVDHDIVYGGQYKLVGDILATFGNRIEGYTYKTINPETEELLDIKDFITFSGACHVYIKTSGLYIKDDSDTIRIMYNKLKPELFEKVTSIPSHEYQKFNSMLNDVCKTICSMNCDVVKTHSCLNDDCCTNRDYSFCGRGEYFNGDCTFC